MLKTKYLLPLILILFLSFTLIGDCWLGGYKQRVKLTIDNANIDSALTWFPIMAEFGQLQLPRGVEKSSRRPGMQAIYDSTANKTFIVFMGEGTHPWITYYDHANKIFASPVKVGTSPDEDHHHHPSLLIDSSGYLWVFYGAHNLEALKYAKSDNVRDISAWTDTTLTEAATAWGPFCVENAAGHIYVFYRKYVNDTHRPLWYVKTVDSGANWSAAAAAIDNTNEDDMEEIYLGKIAYEAAHDAIPEKLHMIWTMAGGPSHDTYHEDIHYAYFKFSDDHFYAADDTDLGVAIDNAELEANTKVVDTGAADDKDTSYINGVWYKPDGTPIIVYGNDVTDGWFYSEYDSGWSTPVELFSGYGDRLVDITYEDSTIKILIPQSNVLREFTSTDGTTFTITELFDTGVFIPNSEYVVDHTSLMRITTRQYLDGYTNDSPFYFYPGNSIEIFDELTADASFDKCAFTSSDEVTELFGDNEYFNASLKRAVYWYSKTGWEIASDAATESYFYYDTDASNNTAKISASGGTAAQSVYDANFKAVYHMHDATTSTILDSTSNNNDGTKKGANEPIEVIGKVGQGQSFAGDDDYIDCGTGPSIIGTGDFTVEAIIKTASSDRQMIINQRATAEADPSYSLEKQAIDDIYATTYDAAAVQQDVDSVDATFADGNYHHVAFVRDGTTTVRLYHNGAVDGTADEGNPAVLESVEVDIGRWSGGSLYWNGLIDEVRISDSERVAAWIKATHYSLGGSLLTYGSEEEIETTTNIMFIFSNF